MVLKYRLEYLSNNSVLIKFLKNIAKSCKIDELEITRDEDYVEVYCKADAETLENFANKISQNLPMSIFLRDSEVIEIDQISKIKPYNYKEDSFKLPFCPSCIEKIENEESEDYYNPFAKCKVCGNNSGRKKRLKLVTADDEVIIKDYKALIEQIALQIDAGCSIKIETASGRFIFKAFEPEIDEEDTLLFTNLNNISSILVATKTEIVALASLEKPKISLNFNEVFKQKNSPRNDRVTVRYIDDLLLYMLSKQLEKYEIEILSYKDDGDYDLKLVVENFEKSLLKTPLIKLMKNNRLLVLEDGNYDEQLDTLFSSYEEKGKSQFITTLHENDLYEKTILNFYLSTKADDNICVYSKEFDGFVDILNYELPNNMNTIFDAISSDEVGAKLIKNYSEKFPENYAKALEFDINTLNKKSILSFWEIAGVILGFEKEMLVHATSCLLEKGPRIDYSLVKNGRITNKDFNYSSMFKSGISYKLAGAENNTIALGYIESYTEFLSNMIDEVNEKMPLDGICLSGNLVANDLIYNFIQKSINENHQIHYNKDFIIEY